MGRMKDSHKFWFIVRSAAPKELDFLTLNKLGFQKFPALHHEALMAIVDKLSLSHRLVTKTADEVMYMEFDL